MEIIHRISKKPVVIYVSVYRNKIIFHSFNTDLINIDTTYDIGRWRIKYKNNK